MIPQSLDAITKEEVLEWIDGRLGLVYLGLTQLADCPGYWETYYEDEIEPLESIRALILAPPVAPARVTVSREWVKATVREILTFVDGYGVLKRRLSEKGVIVDGEAKP